MPKPDTRMDDKRRAVAKKALDEIRANPRQGTAPVFEDAVRGYDVAGELSDDPEEANVQAEQYFQDRPTPLTRGQVTGADEPGRWDEEWWNEAGRTRGFRNVHHETPEMSVAQAADPEGGQTVEEARGQYEGETEGWPHGHRGLYELPGYSKEFHKIVGGLPDQEAYDLMVRPWMGIVRSERHPDSPYETYEDMPGIRNWQDMPSRSVYPLLRPEIRKVMEQLDALGDKYRAKAEAKRPRQAQQAEFEEEFPPEGGSKLGKKTSPGQGNTW